MIYDMNSWAGVCLKCNLWRKRKQVIINVVSNIFYCQSCGGKIRKKCADCGKGTNKSYKTCKTCNGKRMLDIEEEIQ